METRRGIDVVLIGRERWGDENLALRYLATALRKAGHEARILPLNGPGDLEGITAAVLRLGPPLVGLSMSDPDGAIDALALARMLRKQGYEGIITCGGSLATLTRFELLETHPDIDSVVRHDGEIPIVAMADAVLSGKDFSAIPGLTTRSGDILPAAVCDPMPLATRPLRKNRLPEIMGVATARIVASRGCPGRCAYCAPASIQEEAVREARLGGMDEETIRTRGIGATRRRPVDDVADEMAFLYHEKRVRFFHFLDDNFLPKEEPEALDLVESFSGALKRRGVGDIALALQVPAASLTEKVADSLVRMGLVRAMLGVESFDDRTLRTLGRGGKADRGPRSIDLLTSRGVVTFFNALLVHPDSTPASVEAELGMLEGVRDALFDALVVTVYTGSRLWRRLCSDGKIDGNILAWRYPTQSAVVERLRAAMLRLRWQGFGRYDATIYAHDVAVGVAVAGRLGLLRSPGEAQSALRRVFGACNGLKLAVMRDALEIAKTATTDEERSRRFDMLLREAHRRTSELFREIRNLENRLKVKENGARGPSASFLRSCLAAGFAFCLGTGTGGCYESSSHSHADAAEESAGEMPVSDFRQDQDVQDVRPDPVPDWPPDPMFDESPGCDDPRSDASVAALDWNTQCDAPGGYFEQYTEVKNIAEQHQACASCLPDPRDCYYLILDNSGHVVDVRTRDGSQVPAAVRQCYLEAMSPHVFPCLTSGDHIEFNCVICLY